MTQLRAVTVVATPAERAAPLSATHVDAATIAVTPSQSPYDLLRQTAGVAVHEQGQGPGFASDASMRGFSSDHATDVALWVDGVPVNEPVNGHAEGYNDWSVLFPGGIQDIDVIRGPTSALFGNFALSGVVNVRTLERMIGTEATLTGGAFGRGEGMLLTGFDHGSAGGGVLGARFAREDGFRPNAGYNLGQAHARLVHDLAPGVRIDGGVELYSSGWRSPGYLSEDQFAAGQYEVVSNPTDGGFKRRAQERVSLSVIAGTALWRTTAYATQSRWSLFLTIPPAGGQFEGTGSQTEEEDRRHGYGATSALTWTLPHSGEVTIGAEARWDESHYENYYTTARARDSVNALVAGRQELGALFVQGHTDLTDRLRVDLGARYDALGTRSAPDSGSAVSATHAVLSPKLGALYRLAPALGVYGNLSRGFRSSDGVIIDPTLTPITVWASEGGVKLTHGDAFAQAALFRMDVSNEQTLNPLTLLATNGGRSRRQGLELEWRVPLVSTAADGAGATRVGVALSGDWTFNDARYRTATVAPDDGGAPAVLDGLRVYNTSKYVGLAALDVAPASRAWRARISGTFNGPYSPFDEPGIVTGAWALLHVSGAVRVPGLGRAAELGVGVRNVFDRRYPELIAGGVVSPGQPRAFEVSLRMRP
ncbi:MAG TPA: TonB-dependent receptor [Gemmatirosa sp.]